MEKVGAYTERSTESGEWRSGNPSTGQTATPMLAQYFNMQQRELTGVVKAAGLELDKEDDKQLLKAIRLLRGGAAINFGQWLWSASTAGNPGARKLALDNALPSSATTLFIDEVSAEDVDFTQSFGLLRAGDTITLQATELSHRIRVTGQAVAHGTYCSVPVDYVSGAGGVPEADTVVSVLMTQAGAADSSDPVFMPTWWPNRASIPAGYAPADGQLLSRVTFPDAWAGIAAGNMPTVADAVWLSTPTERGKYTMGDGVTTFRLPDYNGKAAGSIGAPFMRGDGALSAAIAGVIQRDALQDINATIAGVGGAYAVGPTADGAAEIKNYVVGGFAGTGGSGGRFDIEFKASKVARTASETRPLSVTGCWIVKLFGAVTNPGSADAAQLATDLAALVTRVTALEAARQVLHVRDQKPAGTAGGTSTDGAWRTRDINTVAHNSITGAVLSANQITLPAGTYEIDARAPLYRPATAAYFTSHARLARVDGSTVVLGATTVQGGNGSYSQVDSVIRGRFTLAAATVLELQHYSSGASSTPSGYGYAANVPGVEEIYSEVIIRRVV